MKKDVLLLKRHSKLLPKLKLWKNKLKKSTRPWQVEQIMSRSLITNSWWLSETSLIVMRLLGVILIKAKPSGYYKAWVLFEQTLTKTRTPFLEDGECASNWPNYYFKKTMFYCLMSQPITLI